MDATSRCERCGHGLGIGRYCVNCGAPVDRTDTAERPAVPGGIVGVAEPTVSAPPSAQPPPRAPTESPWGPPPSTPPPAAPPPAFETPPKARYPLWADEGPSGSAGHDADVEQTAVGLPPAAWQPVTDPSPGPRRRGPGVLPVVLVVLVVLLAAGGAFLLLNGGDDTDTDEADPGRASDTAAERASASSERPSAGGSTSPSEPTPTDATTRPPKADEPRDVARRARASAPRTAPASTDVAGNAVRYDAFNMLDGQPDTAWRAPGDGSGLTLRFVLADPTELTEVGLVNGYAKREPGYDGYRANRRVVTAVWTFADGTEVTQTFGNGRSLQTIEVDVVTDTVDLRITQTTPPAKGPSGRNFTAISEVSFVGTPIGGG